MYKKNLKSDFNNSGESVILRGIKYLIPSNSYDYKHLSVKRLNLDFDGQSIVTDTDSPCIALDINACSVMSLSLRIGNEDFTTSEEDTKAIFHLYREGTEHSIATFEGWMFENSESVLSASEANEIFSVGRYYLVGGNVLGESDEFDESVISSSLKRFYYTFEILPLGISLEHSDIKYAEILRKSHDVRAGRYTSGTLRLSLLLQTSLVSKSILRASCYTQEWSLMSVGECFHPHGRHTHEKISISFRSKRIWTEGKYFIVLSHNGEPYVSLHFHYEGKAITACEVHLLSPSDKEYMLVKKVEVDKTLQWNEISRIHGMADVRSQLVDFYCRNDFDSLCIKYNLPLLRSHRYAAVCSPMRSNANRLAEALSRLLHFRTSGTHTFSCQRCSIDDIREVFDEDNDHTVILHDISALIGSKLQEVESIMQVYTHSCHIIFVGSEREFEQLCKYSQVISDALTESPRFTLTMPSVAETIDTLRLLIEKEHFKFAPETEDALCHQVTLHHQLLCQWSEKECMRYIRNDIAQRVRTRVLNCINERELSPDHLLTLHPTDIDIAAYFASASSQKDALTNESLFHQSMSELNAMVGLTALKEQITSTFSMMRFNARRHQLGLPSDSTAIHHMLFTGNPGTGKTTVAKLIGKIYHAMGYLSKGDVITTDRVGLVGKYIGHTEDNMTQLLERAKGNVLFIDEAYTLCDTTDDRKDFGYHVIDALLPVMAEPHPDMIIIFAGYAEEMDRLMNANQGLKGRFAHHFHFDDYTADELMKICHNLLGQYQYTLTDDALTLLGDIVTRTVQYKVPHFCNARWIKQFVESGLLPAMAHRVMRTPHESTDSTLYTIIEAADVQEAARIYAPLQSRSQPKPRIGFVA